MWLWALLAVQVEAHPPPGLDLSKPFRDVRADGQEVPAQAGRTSIVLPGPGDYKAEAVAPKDFPRIEIKDDGRSLHLGKALTYNYAVVEAPEGVDKAYDRSGYIHPLRTPDGRTITNDFGPKHLHH